MSETKERLEKTGAECLKAYGAWSSDQKNTEAREALQDTIHELRKAVSRLEIELAISERDQMTQKQIPIPPHRAARGKSADAEFDPNDNRGNSDSPAVEKKGPKVQRRRSGPRKSASGNS